MAARISEFERDQRAVISAHTFMFGCGNGGRDFDEAMDPTEGVSVLTEFEREQQKYGVFAPDPIEELTQEVRHFLVKSSQGEKIDSAPINNQKNTDTKSKDQEKKRAEEKENASRVRSLVVRNCL